MTATPRKPIEIHPLLGIPLLFGAALLSIPYMLVAMICAGWRERRLFRRLKRLQRTLAWHEVEQHLRDGDGTLIIEQAQKQPLRLWWTPDDIPASAPVTVPALADIDFVLFDPNQPFTAWCYQRYLSLVTGTAALTRPTRMDFPPGFLSPDFFTTRFPSARVIATTFTRQLPNDRNA